MRNVGAVIFRILSLNVRFCIFMASLTSSSSFNLCKIAVKMQTGSQDNERNAEKGRGLHKVYII